MADMVEAQIRHVWVGISTDRLRRGVVVADRLRRG